MFFSSSYPINFVSQWCMGKIRPEFCWYIQTPQVCFTNIQKKNDFFFPPRFELSQEEQGMTYLENQIRIFSSKCFPNTSKPNREEEWTPFLSIR